MTIDEIVDERAKSEFSARASRAHDVAQQALSVILGEWGATKFMGILEDPDWVDYRAGNETDFAAGYRAKFVAQVLK